MHRPVCALSCSRTPQSTVTVHARKRAYAFRPCPVLHCHALHGDIDACVCVRVLLTGTESREALSREAHARLARPCCAVAAFGAAS